MKIYHSWDEKMTLNEVNIRIHPVNKNIVQRIEKVLKEDSAVEVINPKNERMVIIDCSSIYLIEAMDHLSKLITIDDEVFYIKGRLKDLEGKLQKKVLRINNSTLLNINEIESFKNGNHARLEVHTKNQQVHIVSRHYAKNIKEELKCLKN